MFSKLSMRPSLWALVIGMGVGAAAVFPFLWVLILIAIAPFLRLIDDTTLSWKTVAWRAMWFGLGYTSVVFFWTWSWLGLLFQTDLPKFLSFVMSVYTWALTVLAPIIGYTLWALAHHRIKHVVHNRHYAAIASALALVVAEFSAAIFFHLFYFGDGATLAPHFSFSMLGYALGQSTLMVQYAWIGGVWLLSFVVMYANIALYEWYAHRIRMFGYVFVGLFVVAGLIYGFRSASDRVFPTMNIGVMHTVFDTNFEDSDDWLAMRYTILNNQLADFIGKGPDMVVLPEGSGVMELGNSFGEKKGGPQNLQTLIREGVVVADPSSVVYNNKKHARIHYWGTPGDQYADKHVLLPQGEYVPYIQKAAQTYIADTKTIQHLQEIRTFAPGAIDSNIAVKGTIVAGRFCSESMSPFLYAFNAARGARVFVNVASHSWFLESALLAYRTEGMARVRAVESSRWYVQSANKTSSFVADHMGRIVAYVGTNGSPKRSDVVTVQLRDDVGPYQRLVNAFIYAFEE